MYQDGQSPATSGDRATHPPPPNTILTYIHPPSVPLPPIPPPPPARRRLPSLIHRRLIFLVQQLRIPFILPLIQDLLRQLILLARLPPQPLRQPRRGEVSVLGQPQLRPVLQGFLPVDQEVGGLGVAAAYGADGPGGRGGGDGVGVFVAVAGGGRGGGGGEGGGGGGGWRVDVVQEGGGVEAFVVGGSEELDFVAAVGVSGGWGVSRGRGRRTWPGARCGRTRRNSGGTRRQSAH